MHTTATYGRMHNSNHGIGQCVLGMRPHPWDRGNANTASDDRHLECIVTGISRAFCNATYTRYENHSLFHIRIPKNPAITPRERTRRISASNRW